MSYKTWKRNKTAETRNIFCECRKKVKKLIRAAKTVYSLNMLKEDLPAKQVWNNIRRLFLGKSDSLNLNVSSNEINQHFVNSNTHFSHSTNVTVFNSQAEVPSMKFYFHTVSEEFVMQSVKSIKSNSLGDDGIPVKFLKILLPILTPVITFLINSCLSESVIPKSWKIANLSVLCWVSCCFHYISMIFHMS